jgi:hypothetical protein
MAREPHYPDDAPIGGAARAADDDFTPPPAPAPRASDPKRGKHLMTGAAIGIGSAAIVAALLYANRKKGGDRSGNG